MPDLHQIRDSNSVMVAAIMQSLGIDAIAMHRATDSAEAIIERVEACEDCELIILNGRGIGGALRSDSAGGVPDGMANRVPQGRAEARQTAAVCRQGRGGCSLGCRGTHWRRKWGRNATWLRPCGAMCGRRPEPLGGEACLTEAVHNRGARELFVLSRVTTEETGWDDQTAEGIRLGRCLFVAEGERFSACGLG